MSCDWDGLLGAAPRWVLVANLPYNVATPLVLDLLHDVPAIGRMLVMVQREAGERLVAVPGRKSFGAVSLRVGYFATAALVVAYRLACSCPSQTSSQCWWSSCAASRRQSTPLSRATRRSTCLYGPALVGGGKCSAGHSMDWSTRQPLRQRDRRPSPAEELGIEEWGKLSACRRLITS